VVRLESGDAVVFDGGIAANLLHGVEGVEPGVTKEEEREGEA